MTIEQMIILALINLALSAFWYWRGAVQGAIRARNLSYKMLDDGILKYDLNHPYFKQNPDLAARLKAVDKIRNISERV